MATKVPVKLWFLVFCVGAICLAKAKKGESNDPMVTAFKSLKGEEEKTDFLSYFLALGLQDWASNQPRPPKFLTFGRPDIFIRSLNISSENIERFESMNIPEESRMKLLVWTKMEFNLTTKNVLELLRRQKCPKSVCLPDIGELCCPW